MEPDFDEAAYNARPRGQGRDRCQGDHKSPRMVLNEEDRCVTCCQGCDDVAELWAQNYHATFPEYQRMHKAHAKACHPNTNTHSGNGTHKGAWAFTLTKSPTDDLSEEDMVKAVRKLMAQQSCPVEKYAWYLEHKDEDTHPHIHGMYQTSTGGKIEAKHFKRAWPIWDPSVRMGAGFRGGYHRPVRSDEKYSAYIAKDGGVGDSSE